MEEFKDDLQQDDQESRGPEATSAGDSPASKYWYWIVGLITLMVVSGLVYYYYFGFPTIGGGIILDDPRLLGTVDNCISQMGEPGPFVPGEILLSFKDSTGDAEANSFLKDLGFSERLNNDEQRDYVRSALVWKPEWADIWIELDSPERNERPFLQDFTDEEYIDYMRRESTSPERVTLAAQIEERGSTIVRDADPYAYYNRDGGKTWPAIRIWLKESPVDWTKSVVKVDIFRSFMNDNFPDLEILDEEGLMSLDFSMTLRVPRGKEVKWVCTIRALANPIVAGVGLNGLATTLDTLD